MSHVPPYEMSEFKLLSDNEIKTMITSGNSKSCMLDPIPTSLLKQILPTILPTIRNIINMSLGTSQMPAELKEATVKPLLKKQSLDSENLQNYRPVSNLAYIGKLIEAAAVNQMNEHMSQHKLHEPLQSAYKAGHSVETALTKVSNDILMDMDKGKCAMLILLDLSAAFDTIDHNVFLNRIKHDSGIVAGPHKWLKSYFTDRYQSVNVQIFQ